MKKSLYLLGFVCVALFPILFLYSNNVDQIEFDTIFRSLALTLFGSLILLFVLTLVTRNLYRSIIIASILTILIFSYGHTYGLIKNSSFLGVSIGRHRFLASFWIFLFIFFIWLAFWRISHPDKILRAIYLISIVLLILPLSNIIWFHIRDNVTNSSQRGRNLPPNEIQVTNRPFSSLPDIYYIIMDGYPRQDTLEEVFNFDNEPFLKTLEDMGFYIGRCSQSNYAKTELSLASSLNMAYLEDLGESFQPDDSDRFPLRDLIEYSSTRQTLTNLGYSTVSFETGYYWSNLHDADLSLSPASTSLDKWSFKGGLNGFEVMLIKSSLGQLVADGVMVLPSVFELNLEYPNQTHRERVQFSLSQLKTIPGYPGPKFVFAHIISPHHPLVFKADGSPVLDPVVNEEDAPLILRKNAYRQQIAYLNSELVDLVDVIIKDSSQTPIIIIQGDHGPAEDYAEEQIRHRMNILNAYYIPQQLDSNSLYPHISPVNSFRVLFNSLLNADLLLLEDVSHFSNIQQPYLYTIVENKCAVEFE